MTAYITRIAADVAAQPVPAAAAAAAVLAALWLAVRAARKAAQSARGAARGRRASAADAFTLAVAGLATALAVTGMYHFFGAELHDGGAERALFCGALELATFAEAVRAKRNMAENATAGVDGAAMWALAALSGVLSAWAAGSLAAAAFRVCMPLVAAWLWHRGLALERRRTGGAVIAWRITPERVLVRLGLADPSGRTTGEAAAQRRLTILARAAKRVRVLDRPGTRAWWLRHAERRLDTAMTRAVEYAGLAADPGRQAALLAQMGALYGARTLADLDPPPPWAAPQPPALPPQFADQAAAMLADLAAELAATRAARLALESAAPPVRPDRGAGDAAAPDRDALLAELTADLLAIPAGDKWRPDYDDLMTRTGRSKRWCEALTADVRRAVLGPQPARAPATAEPAAAPAVADRTGTALRSEAPQEVAA
jgi:hypothetical protein